MKFHGERDGTRALIEVLLLGCHMTHEHAVAAWPPRQAEPAPDSPAPGQPSTTVTSLWRFVHLPPDTMPLSSVAHYGQLLRHPTGGMWPGRRFPQRRRRSVSPNNYQ
jgi:hypothetical protein